MVFKSLRDKLSSLWNTGTDANADAGTGSDAQSTDGGTDAASASAGAPDAGGGTNERLSYAEQVEYGVDERDLADEDRILRLLVKRGGRVDETTILEETGWTEERLSSVVTEMEADDQISAITVGRKHVICRRGFEPKGYRSHLHE